MVDKHMALACSMALQAPASRNQAANCAIGSSRSGRRFTSRLYDFDGAVGDPALEAFLRNPDLQPALDWLLFLEDENTAAFRNGEVGGVSGIRPGAHFRDRRNNNPGGLL